MGKNYVTPEKREVTTREGDGTEKKTATNNIPMVNVADMETIIADTVAVSAGNYVRGKANSMANLGKFAIADTIYTYALDDRFNELFAPSRFPTQAKDISDELAKVVGLGVSFAIVEGISGNRAMGALAWDSVMTSTSAVIGTKVYEMVKANLPAKSG